MTIGYLVDEELVVGLQALSLKLGKPVSSKDILENKVEGVKVVAVVRGSVEPDSIPEDKRDNTVYTALEDEDFISLMDTSEEDFEKILPRFEGLADYKQFVADLDTRSLEYLARGLDVHWTPTYHRHIHRMRISMALRKQIIEPLINPSTSKKRMKYAEMTNEELVATAVTYGISNHPIKTPIDRIQLTSSLSKRSFG